MASRYIPNKWELYDPNLPDEIQVNSYITKRRLEHMEEGIRSASIKLEIGTVKIGNDDNYGVVIVEDKDTETRRLNITFPPAGKGDPGQDGKSAYQTWVELGNQGTEQEFIDYLKGIDGKDGKDGKDGADGQPGPAGESAYQSWLALGNTGTINDFINSLKGDKGDKGDDGISGKDNYELWKLIPGNENKSIIEFFESLKGEQGEQGPAGITEFVDF